MSPVEEETLDGIFSKSAVNLSLIVCELGSKLSKYLNNLNGIYFASIWFAFPVEVVIFFNDTLFPLSSEYPYVTAPEPGEKDMLICLFDVASVITIVLEST